jgi:DNA invertase Pin-like site-specific DNA recombinase
MSCRQSKKVVLAYHFDAGTVDGIGESQPRFLTTYQIAYRSCDRRTTAMPGILVGYARTSTCDQQAGLDAQIRDLKAAGCEEIFSEQVSAVAQRDRLKEALRFVRRGDTLVACKPDRLARSTTELLRIVDDLDRRGVGLIMLSMGGQRIDTRAPTGKLMISLLGAIAEFERGLLLERQREGVAKAKLDGKYKGRKPTARVKAAEVIRLDAVGLQRTEIARRTGVGIASVYRILADARMGVSIERAS